MQASQQRDLAVLHQRAAIHGARVLSTRPASRAASGWLV